MTKKIISVLSAVALSFSALSIVALGGYGDVTLVDAVGKTSINANTKAQYLAIKSTDMIGQNSASGEFFFAVPAGKCIGVVKSNGVGLSYYSEDDDDTYYPTTQVNLIADANDDTANDGYDTVKVNYSGTYPYTTADGILMEFGLKPADATSIDMEIKFIGGSVETWDGVSVEKPSYPVTDAAKAVTYVSKSGTCTVETKSDATPTPTATATPTPTPTVEPTPEVTPEPVAGVEKFSDTDAAAWAWETAAVAGSKVKVTVTDGTTEGAKTFDLNAAVEGSVKVGVIVQYNPTAFPNFAIVDVEIQ